MRAYKIVLLFTIFLIFFISCSTTQLRSMHNNELRAELERFNEYLDIRESLIFLTGWSYSFFHSSPPQVTVHLRLIPNYDNHETIVWIRDELIYFFESNNWEQRGEHGYLHGVTISFRFEDDGRIRAHTAMRSSGIWYWGHDGTRSVLTFNEAMEN